VVGLIARIEREAFRAAWLLERQTSLRQGAAAASATIARLRRVVALVESFNHNVLFIPVARALLLPEQCAMAISRWHAEHGRDVATWLRVTGEVEAVSALSAYAFERPADPFPDLRDAGVVFQAEDLAHPLIDDGTAVANDVRLGGGQPQLLVVSGSNMSGKSTLLRAAGVNVVLALAGAPVRATSLRMSWLAIGATLRVEDSLEQGRSRFYAEIVRIRAIVDIARRGAALLFLLDEILHGTNSYDRRIGAEAIVRDLVAHGAIGMITTHDLALTGVVDTLGAVAANMHFEDRMEDGRMRFDYRMRPGVVEHSNALALMRAVGLDV
jgi:DNA mismatch repair ATPase MutS